MMWQSPHCLGFDNASADAPPESQRNSQQLGWPCPNPMRLRVGTLGCRLGADIVLLFSLTCCPISALWGSLGALESRSRQL